MVENNDVESAMKVLNGVMAQEGLYQRWTSIYQQAKKTREINFTNFFFIFLGGWELEDTKHRQLLDEE